MGHAALVVLLLACGCDEKSGGGGGGTVLFSDDFSGGFPAPKWVGAGAIDATAGTPAPSMHIQTTPPTGMIGVQMVDPVQVGAGLIFRFSATVPSNGGFGTIFLNDTAAGGQALAYITFRGLVNVEYSITGTSTATQAVSAPAGEFHEYELLYLADGASSWSRDGAVQVQGNAITSATLTRLVIDTSSPAGFSVDEIEIVSR